MQPHAFGQPNMPPKKKDNTVIIIIAVVLAVFVFGVIGLGVFSSLAIFGVSRYMSTAKIAEGRNGLGAMARGILSCVEREGVDPLTGAEMGGKLPPSSAKVPASLSMVSARKYQSADSEWSSDPAFSCAHFQISEPQYFQYQWELDAGKMSGTGRALADFDGDGKAEVVLEQPVTCTAPQTGTALSCRVGAQRQVQ